MNCARRSPTSWALPKACRSASPATSSRSSRNICATSRTSSQDLLTIIDAILDLTTIDAGAMELRLAAIDVVRLMQEVGEAAGPVDDQARSHPQYRGRRGRRAASSAIPSGCSRSCTTCWPMPSASRPKAAPSAWVRRMTATTSCSGSPIPGRGIEPEFQKRVFDRFQSKPMPGGHRGPGLGLAIVKSFVELHGGQVSLLSQVNKGTTVICRFPMRGPHAQDRGSHQEHRRGTVAA